MLFQASERANEIQDWLPLGRPGRLANAELLAESAEKYLPNFFSIFLRFCERLAAVGARERNANDDSITDDEYRCH